MSETEPIDPLVLITAEIINVPQTRGLTEPETRMFFDFVALGCEQMLELFTQFGCSKCFPQILDKAAFDELRAALTADNTDPSKVRYETNTSVLVVVLVRPAETVTMDADAVMLGRELAVVHLGRLIDQTGTTDLRNDEVLKALHVRLFGNVSSFEQMCRLTPRKFRAVSWTNLFDL